MGSVQAFGENDLELVIASMEAKDIRTVLNKRKIHRKRIAKAAYAAQGAGIITGEEFSAIAEKIARPKAFPSDQEQRLEAVLAGFMNAETKQILVMLLNSGITELGSLIDQFSEATGKSWTRHQSLGNLTNYMAYSIDTIGFVAHPVVIRQPFGDVDVGYALTEAGMRYGLPLGAFGLNLSNKIGLSLHQILGSTSTSGDSRSPYNRFRVLEELLKGDCRIKDLAFALNLASISKRHLKQLKEAGLVEFDSLSPEDKGWAVYAWVKGVPSDAKPVNTLTTLTRQVADCFFKQSQAEYNQAFLQLSEEPMYKETSKMQLKKRIKTVVSGLAEQGLIKKLTDYKSSSVLSHVSLTESGREFAGEFTRKVRSAMRDEGELEAMRRIYQGYVSNPSRFREHATRGMELYLPVSLGRNQTPFETWQARIVEYLSEVKKARLKDITNAMGMRMEGPLSRMGNEGTVVKTSKGNATYYELAKTAPVR